MDGVIADVETHLLEKYELRSGISLTKQQIIGRNDDTLFPENLLVEFLNEPHFFRTVPVMDGAVEALRKLSQNFEIYIVSAATEFPLSFGEKLAWLNEHFSFVTWHNIVFCGKKSIIKTDYMVDDMCKNLDHCLGKRLLFTAFHNHDVKHHQRFDDWDSILEFFESEVIA